MSAKDPHETPADLELELLGGARRYDRAEVSRLAGVDEERSRRLWRALGFADVPDGVVAFTDADVEALRTVELLLHQGLLDDETQVAMTRAMGQSMARLAEWQVSALTQGLVRDEAVAPDAALATARGLVPVIEHLLGYVWRRQLAASAGRALASSPDELVARTMAVGFADLVGFTSLTRHVDETQLAALVERFEAVASDVVVANGGRVVKTVGDEVMFTADTPESAAETALCISDRICADGELPDIRVGVAYGSVLSRLGDVYGEPVNIAARLTSIARPGSVLVDRDLAGALDGDERWRLRRMAPRPVRGYAMLHASRLRRADDSAGSDG